MKGRIVKRSKENYTIILSLPRDASTGKYKQKWISAHGKRPVVERQLTDLMHRYNTTGFLDDDNVKTAVFLERWLTVYKPHVSTQSYDRSASIVHRHLIPDLGEVPLAKLLPEHLQRHYAKCAAARLKARDREKTSCRNSLRTGGRCEVGTRLPECCGYRRFTQVQTSRDAVLGS